MYGKSQKEKLNQFLSSDKPVSFITCCTGSAGPDQRHSFSRYYVIFRSCSFKGSQFYFFHVSSVVTLKIIRKYTDMTFIFLVIMIDFFAFIIGKALGDHNKNIKKAQH